MCVQILLIWPCDMEEYLFIATSSIISACLTWFFHKVISSKFSSEEKEKDSKSRN